MSQVQNGGGLKASGLVVERGGRRVIDDLSFDLMSGSALLLTGANGAGKTTLIRALAGLLPVSGGTIEFAGTGELEEIGPDQRLSERCHYVGHMNAAKPELTVRENLRFWRQFMGVAEAKEVAAMKQVGLASLADIPVRYLSAGQQRRVAIGRLLIADRPLWLLDEPTVSLDAANVARLVAFGNAHLAAGGMIIAATHIPLTFEPSRELRLSPVEHGTNETAGATV